MVPLLLASCGSDMVSSADDIVTTGVPIGFSCLDNDNNADARPTRGSQVTTETGIGSFIVNARYYQTSGGAPVDYLHNQTVSYNTAATTWTYTPQRYWPSTGEIDFFAYSPAAPKGTIESLTLRHDGYPDWMLRYNVKNPVITSINELEGSSLSADVWAKACDAENQEDLLLSINPQVSCADQTAGSKVALHFLHALAGLRFQFAGTYSFPEGTTHVILAVAPLSTGGTISMNRATGTDTSPTITWSLDESEATYYQAYTLSADHKLSTDGMTFFLPPQTLKNFTVIARFYKQENGTYTHLATKSSKKINITLQRAQTTTVTIE